MNREALLGLALAAIDDVDARVVLADAVEETGFDDAVALGVACKNDPAFWREWMALLEARKNDWYPRAVAAYLLCESWPTSWPLALRCRRRLTWSGVEMYVDGLRVDWPRLHDVQALPRALTIQVEHGDDRPVSPRQSDPQR